jgi:hypothetical protein
VKLAAWRYEVGGLAAQRLGGIKLVVKHCNAKEMLFKQ